MPMWPFNRRPIEALSPEELQDRLIAAAAGSKRGLRALCQQYKDAVAANLDSMSKVPNGIRSDPSALDRFVQHLGAVAHCLAKECNAPELWNRLSGTPEDNPLLMWERWYAEFPRRVERLEHDELIGEARSFIESARTLEGYAARQNEAMLHGRLGELLFHSGKASLAIEPFEAALRLCREIEDLEGQATYSNNLLEVHRYNGHMSKAVSAGVELIELFERLGKNVGLLQKRLRWLREGEPLCRIVCVRDANEWELDELTAITDGRYEFRYRRNRLSLRKTTTLTDQGNRYATDGQFADALAKYQEAVEVDPHDPDPLYQSGICLLELGAYRSARETFEVVERIAPGWFRCRTDRWLAEGLENATVSEDEFHLLRTLDDGGLDPLSALDVASKAVEKYPSFAPFRLALGNLQRNRGNVDAAIMSYRTGLELVAEPDLESRLLCALAAVLPKHLAERKLLIEHAIGRKGNLVAQASARLMAVL
jgi:tetratricopeptide (TPR) repeat protein